MLNIKKGKSNKETNKESGIKKQLKQNQKTKRVYFCSQFFFCFFNNESYWSGGTRQRCKENENYELDVETQSAFFSLFASIIIKFSSISVSACVNRTMVASWHWFDDELNASNCWIYYGTLSQFFFRFSFIFFRSFFFCLFRVYFSIVPITITSWRFIG